MKMKKRGGGQKTQAAEVRSFKGWGRRCFVLTPVEKLCLFQNAIQNVENFCSLVSAQGVYLFCFNTSHVLKVMLKLNPHD